MYIYQNGKLYVHDGEQLVGVEIHPDKVVKVQGTKTKLSDKYSLLTPHEVQCKFHINEKPYIFPIDKKKVENEEVKDSEPTNKAKRTTRKSTRK